MHEADMKCKGAACLLLSSPDHALVKAAYLLHSILIAATLTRSRKLVAESTFCHQLAK